MMKRVSDLVWVETVESGKLETSGDRVQGRAAGLRSPVL